MSREVVESDCKEQTEVVAAANQFPRVPNVPYQIYHRRAPQAVIRNERPTNTRIVHQHDKTTNFSDEKIVIKRRSSRKMLDAEKSSLSELKYSVLKRTFVDQYANGSTTDVAKVQLCIDLISYDVDLKSKYEELDFKALLDKNMVRRRINCLTQALGILEKYGSNLIKPNRPTFWRQVKFTSSLVRAYLENVNGSYDILKQMGYTKVVPDGLAFADDVSSPNVDKVKALAAELFLAKYESDELVHDRHPYLEIKAYESSLISPVTQMTETASNEDSEPEFYDAEDGLSIVNESQNEILPKGDDILLNQEKEQNFADDKQCYVCGKNEVKFFCEECDEHFCADCVKKFHGNKKRQNHVFSEIKSASGEELKTSTPSTANKPVIQPRTQTVVKTIKRPIPTPRKRIPIGATVNESTAPSSQAFETGHQTSVVSQPSIRDELPPPPEYFTQQHQPGFTQNAWRETVPRQASNQGEREIKRPPPFDEASGFNRESQDDHIYESLKFLSENVYSGLSRKRENTREELVPPPLPPRRNLEPQSCPKCYCINEKNVSACVACGASLSKLNSHVQPFGVRSEHLTRIAARYSDNQTHASPENQISSTASSSPGIHWVCSHCTFHNNDMSTKICAMCSKTTEKLVEMQSEDQMASQSTVSAQCEGPTISSPATMSQGSVPGISPWTASTAYNAVYSQQMSFSKAYDPISYRAKPSDHEPISPQLMSMQATYGTNSGSTSTESGPLSHSFSGLISPSYIKLQQAELSSLQTKSLVSSPEIVRLQQQQEEIISHKLQQKREFAQHLQAQPAPSVAVSSHPIPNVASPYVHSNYQLSSGYFSGESTSGYGSIQCSEMEKVEQEGREFVKLLKEAENCGFSAEELNIAYNLQQDESIGPIHWLETEWFDRVQQVMIKFTDISKDENYGNISPLEAREALTQHTGDVIEACHQCIKDRKDKLEEVMTSGIYIRTDVIKALDIYEGDVELTIQHLQRMAFEPLLQKVKANCIDDNVDNRELNHLTRQQSTSQDDEIFEAIVSDKEIDMERRIRVMFAEKDLASWGRAWMAIKLIDSGFPVSDSIEAAKVNRDLEHAQQYLQKECGTCFDKFPESRMVTMLNCQCRFCQDCISQHFSIVIHEQNIKRLVCPKCSEPTNLEDVSIATEYFNNVDILIRRCVNSETHDLFQRKLRDRTLMKEPNFRWCSHCSSGFINEQPQVLKMACPNCNKYSCFRCKKEWEDQHDGISCEQFAAWKEANDPEAQAHGLAAHLKQNGIECPNCKFRYDLAKGGCMHFKCVQCNHEFCSGCYQPFRHSQHCPVSASCARLGLHAHHPRDCLFYLRDRNPDELKKLLDDNNVQYNTEPPQRQPAGADEVQGAAAAADTGRCKVMEQRETGAGLQDGECGRETCPGYAGLCRLHFCEYLVELINLNFIDPVGIFDIHNLRAVLSRNDLVMPKKQRREKDKDYHKRIAQHVQQKLPLPRKTPRRRVLDIDDLVPGLPQGQQAQDILHHPRVVDLEGDQSDSSEDSNLGTDESDSD